VDAVVGRLLAVTGPRGGDLLRYGGDALLLLFDGPDHEHRAVVAAAAMQTEMSGFRDTQLESGRVTLRMSIGIEAGRIDLFLAGDEHRELLVAGPTASRVVELQQVARAGQIVMGARVAAAVPGRCRGRRVGDGAVHLRRAAAAELGAALESVGPRAVEPSTADTSEAGVPVALRPHLGGTDGEHRQVAVAFVQCRDLDRLLREAGPEAVADELHAFVQAAQRACAHHRVTLLATDVDVSAAKLILVSGAPTTLADDEDRLVAAVRAVLEAHLRQPVRAGVHRGLVFAVEVGDDDRRVYTVLGDTVNVAARVMGVAPDGGLLATTAVLDRLRAAYSHQPVRPFTVKGKTDNIVAAIVDPARGRPPPTLPATDRPLVGREKELAVLAAALESARAGGRPIVEIVGRPGIGKSRLLAEACALAPDLPAVVVQARQYDSAEPYRPVRDPLRSLLGLDGDDDDGLVAEVLAGRVSELVGDLVPLVPLIGVAFGLHLPDTEVTAGLAVDFRREQLHAATTRFLSALLPPSGIFVVEDSYWLDDGSVQLLTGLWRALGTGWAVFVSRGDDPSALDLSDVTGVDRLELEPLPADAARLLARTIGDFTRVEAAALAERSGGNPLFLGELAAAAGRGTSVDDLPDTVEAVIAARLDVLDAHDRDLARVASVLGFDVRADLLLDLATTEGAHDDRHAVRERLAHLAGVLDPDGTGNFRFGAFAHA
ncbi:MAG: AAA family ATPase, partial [Acidimicrobiales bacterium]